VSPAEAIMVGDSYRVDVVAPRALGIDAVLLDREGEAGPDVDGPVIQSLAELLPILEAGTVARAVASATDAGRAG
jgi:FMN phosphatase YigB (HAD superfamily)